MMKIIFKYIIWAGLESKSKFWPVQSTNAGKANSDCCQSLKNHTIVHADLYK